MTIDLIDHLVASVQIGMGERTGIVTEAQRPSILFKTVTRHPSWTEAEDQFLRENVGFLSYEEIGERLGRSTNAVHIRIVRSGLFTARTRPGTMSAHQVAVALGLDGHSVVGWIDNGILPGRTLPLDCKQRSVDFEDLKRWLTRPENWPYFKVNRIRSAHLRRLVQLAQARWGDEWWTTRQVADYHGVDTKTILQIIKRGKVPALQCRDIAGRYKCTWAYWYIRKSDAVSMRVFKGKGSAELACWSRRADAFILRARDMECRKFVDIARMMRWDVKRVMYRYKKLKQGGTERMIGDFHDS